MYLGRWDTRISLGEWGTGAGGPAAAIYFHFGAARIGHFGVARTGHGCGAAVEAVSGSGGERLGQ
jgi:hypothetical protein